jgi:O-antigen ligase
MATAPLPPQPKAHEPSSNGREKALAACLGLLLLAAPLHWAAVPPLPRMLLELGALPILALVFWPGAHWSANRRPPAGLAAALALLSLYPLLYLLPLPAGVWAGLPGAGREPYAQALALFPGESASWRAASAAPAQTEAYWLAFLPPLAVFLGVLHLPEPRRQDLARLAVGMAVLQSLLGLMQYGAARESFLCFGANTCGSSAQGTYYNRDHLAGLLEMLLPLAVGLIGADLGRAAEPPRYRTSWRNRLGFWISGRGHAVAALAAGCVAMLLGLVFTRSRSGILITMLGILVCLAVFARRLGSANRASGVVGTVVVVALGLAVDIGLAPVLGRFSLDDPLRDARWLIYSQAWQGVGQFLPLGSGPGTFPEAFRQFQPAELGKQFVNHAHNDYLEWLFEGGLPGAALAALLLAAYLRQWLGLAGAGRHSAFRFVQFGAGIGLLLLLLHGLTDFNWHIPANAAYAALLAGIFLGRPGHGPARPAADEPRGGAEPPPKPGPKPAFALDRPKTPVQNPFDEGNTE